MAQIIGTYLIRMEKNIQEYRRRKICKETLASSKNSVDGKILADGKNLSFSENSADGKNPASSEMQHSLIGCRIAH